MENLAKGIALVCLLALAVTADAYPNRAPGRTKVAGAKPVRVSYSARVATPIRYTAQDYNGPYDPLDPNGVVAARHRYLKQAGQKQVAAVKSYVPPGIKQVAKKELTQVITGEGKRFAFSHPKETADITGIALKARKLYHNAAEKVKKGNAL